MNNYSEKLDNAQGLMILDKHVYVQSQQETQDTEACLDALPTDNCEFASLQHYPHRPAFFSSEPINQDLYQLVWLEPEHVSQDSETTGILERLRESVGYTKFFNDEDACKRYLKQTRSTITFFVCSEKIGPIFIPQIHCYDNISTIFIYCTNNEYYHQQWISNYKKIERIYSKFEDLLNGLMQSVTIFKQNQKEFLSNDFQSDAYFTDDSLKPWWKDFIDMLCYLPYAEEHIHQLVCSLKAYVGENEAELLILNELETNYNPDKAIWWYTRNTVLDRLLNKALLRQNTKFMLQFGFFLQDLYRQLKDEPIKFQSVHGNDSSLITLYGGRQMRRTEIDELLKPFSKSWRSNKCFFSTRLDRDVALFNLNSLAQTGDHFQNVLFEIVVDIQEKYRPYADISHLSYFPTENEVLFMAGAEFIVIDVLFSSNENIWIVKLRLLTDVYIKNDKDFDGITCRQILKKCVSSLRLHEVDHENIETIFNHLLNFYPSEQWISSVKMMRMAQYQMKSCRYSEAISTYDKALHIWHDYLNDDELTCSLDIAEIHKNIGYCYSEEKNPNAAVKHYELAERSMHLAIEKATTKAEQMKLRRQLSDICEKKAKAVKNGNDRIQNSLMAIKDLDENLQTLLNDSSCTFEAIMYHINNIYRLYTLLSKYDHALDHFIRILDILMSQTYPNPFVVIEICGKIINIYIEYKNDYNAALEYQLIQHEYEVKLNAIGTADGAKSIAEKKKSIADSHFKLAKTYVQVHEYNLAIASSENALQLYKEIKSPNEEYYHTEIQLANIYIQLKQYDLAKTQLTSALELADELYQNTKIYNIERNIGTIEEKLADICLILNQPDATIQHLTRARKWFSKCYDRERLDATIETKLASVKTLSHQYDSANNHLLAALNLYTSNCQTSKYIPDRFNVQEKIADNYIALNDYDSALTYLMKSCELCEKFELSKKEEKMAPLRKKIESLFGMANHQSPSYEGDSEPQK